MRQIIDCDYHVSLTGRSVVRHVISKLRSGYETFRPLSKGERRKLIADCLQVHRNNRKLIRDRDGGLGI